MTVLHCMIALDRSPSFVLLIAGVAALSLMWGLRRTSSTAAPTAASSAAAAPTSSISPTASASLGSLWNSATEFMLGVPTTLEAPPVPRLVLVPQGEVSGRSTLPLPPIFTTHTIFALTAFDPPGVARELAQNTAENARLFDVLRALRNPRPAAAWSGFGVHLTEGWREDGFCLAFRTHPEESGGGMDVDGKSAADSHEEGGNTDGGAVIVDLAAARAAVVRIAKAFDQGAIYEYTRHGSAGGGVVGDGVGGGAEGGELPSCAVRRHTVPAASGAEVAGSEMVVRLRDVPGLPAKLDRPWAGPDAIREIDVW